MLPQGWKSEAILGRGSYGQVRRCTIQGKQYAVKSQRLASSYLYQGLTPKQAVIEHDIGVAAPVDGTLARILGGIVESGSVHFVMPLYGPSVESIVASSPLSLSELFYLVIDLGAALEALHGAGLVHRDVKLANIMVNTSETNGKKRPSYVLGDFGVANVASIASTCIGTPLTMAPEIHTNMQYGPSVDIWGAGCCFYQAIAGVPPFSGVSHRALQLRAARGLSEQQKQLMKDKQDSIGNLIITCLSPSARLRPKPEAVVDMGLAAMLEAGIDDRSSIVRSIPTHSSKIQRRIARATVQRLPSMVSAFRPPTIVESLPRLSKIRSIESEPIEETLGKHRDSTAGRRLSTPQPPKQARKSRKKEELEGIYPLVSHRPGRTLDFDNARYRGYQVHGYKYLGKVYVVRS